MITLTTFQFVMLTSIAALGVMSAIQRIFIILQWFMRPHVFIAELVSERNQIRLLLRTVRLYVPTSTSEGAELQGEIDAALNDASDYKKR